MYAYSMYRPALTNNLKAVVQQYPGIGSSCDQYSTTDFQPEETLKKKKN